MAYIQANLTYLSGELLFSMINLRVSLRKRLLTYS